MVMVMMRDGRGHGLIGDPLETTIGTKLDFCYSITLHSVQRH